MADGVQVRGDHAVLGRLRRLAGRRRAPGRGHGDHDRHVLEAGAEAAHVQEVAVAGAAEHDLQVAEVGVGRVVAASLGLQVDSPQKMEPANLQSVDGLRQPAENISDVNTEQIVIYFLGNI